MPATYSHSDRTAAFPRVDFKLHAWARQRASSNCNMVHRPCIMHDDALFVQPCTPSRLLAAANQQPSGEPAAVAVHACIGCMPDPLKLT